MNNDNARITWNFTIGVSTSSLNKKDEDNNVEFQNKITIDQLREERMNSMINKRNKKDDETNKRIKTVEKIIIEEKGKKRGDKPKKGKKK